MKSKIIPVHSVSTHFADRLALQTFYGTYNRAEGTCAGILSLICNAIVHNFLFACSLVCTENSYKTSPFRNSKYNVDDPMGKNRIIGVIYEPDNFYYSNSRSNSSDFAPGRFGYL